jgi:hypothetical protein
MTALQFFFFVALPVLVGIAGVAYGEAFRIRSKATANEPPLDDRTRIKQRLSP